MPALQIFADVLDTGRGVANWFERYNAERPHQALDYATPAEVYASPASYGIKPAVLR